MKKKLKWLTTIIATLLIGYGSYLLYNYAIEVAIKRIKAGVTTSIRKSILDTINPLKWPGKLFGHKGKDAGEE